MIQAMISPEWIQHWLGRARPTASSSSHTGRAAGELYKGGASLSALVACMTSWSLFGFQRVLAWELPFMGTRFLLARVLPALVFPIVAGYLVRFIYND
jgi:hypothetical protein